MPPPPSPSRLQTSASPGPLRHPWPTIALHWASALLVAGAFVLAWLRDTADDKPLRAVLLFSHSQLGLLVGLLLLMRLAVRVMNRANAPAIEMPAWQRWAGAGGHLALYALLLAQPLLGWAVMNAHGHDPLLFGAWPLPSLANPDPDLADTLAEYHETTAWAMLALIGLHASAALWHHFARGDAVLASMLPGARPRTTGRSTPLPHPTSE